MLISLSRRGIAHLVLLLPLSLIAASTVLAGPADPVAYYRQLNLADRLMDDSDYAGAVEIYQGLSEDYPEDGRTWRRLAQCRYSLKQYAEAADAYERAGEWGVTFPANVSASVPNPPEVLNASYNNPSISMVS